jgi:hypothetical protein
VALPAEHAFGILTHFFNREECSLPESGSIDRDRSALVDCRARVADTRARLALLDEVVSRTEPPAPYAQGLHNARAHLEAALADLDEARKIMGSNCPHEAQL